VARPGGAERRNALARAQTSGRPRSRDRAGRTGAHGSSGTLRAATRLRPVVRGLRRPPRLRGPLLLPGRVVAVAAADRAPRARVCASEPGAARRLDVPAGW